MQHVLQAKPLTQEETQLSDTEFALQELKKSSYDLVYFLPDDAMRALRVIRGLIYTSKKEIKAALFRLTEQSIAKALIEAHNRGVAVELVIDPGALDTTQYSKVAQLIKAGVPVYQYQTTDLFSLAKTKITKPGYQTIMHHKTVVLDVDTQKIVIFGSLNLTHAGFNGNEECVAFRNSPHVVQAFEDHLAKLKNRSEQLIMPQKSSAVLIQELLTETKPVTKSQPVHLPTEQKALMVRPQHQIVNLVARVVAQTVPLLKRVLKVVH
jgi:phosphatidylserine/phosphatidylglycerophosphate/cardiolipin synthase-like enzyme